MPIPSDHISWEKKVDKYGPSSVPQINSLHIFFYDKYGNAKHIINVNHKTLRTSFCQSDPHIFYWNLFLVQKSS